MALQGNFIFFSLSELQEMLAENLAARKAILGRGQTYTIAGRSFGFTDLPSLNKEATEIAQAISRKTGQSSEVVRANFNPGMGRGAR